MIYQILVSFILGLAPRFACIVARVPMPIQNEKSIALVNANRLRITNEERELLTNTNVSPTGSMETLRKMATLA